MKCGTRITRIPTQAVLQEFDGPIPRCPFVIFLVRVFCSALTSLWHWRTALAQGVSYKCALARYSTMPAWLKDLRRALGDCPRWVHPITHLLNDNAKTPNMRFHELSKTQGSHSSCVERSHGLTATCKAETQTNKESGPKYSTLIVSMNRPNAMTQSW